MVKAAEADIIGPAVAAEDPDGLLGEVVLLGEDVARQRAGLAGAYFAVGEPLGFPLRPGQIDVDAVFQRRDISLGGGGVGLAVVIGVEPCLRRGFQFRSGIIASVLPFSFSRIVFWPR